MNKNFDSRKECNKQLNKLNLFVPDNQDFDYFFEWAAILDFTKNVLKKVCNFIITFS